LLAAETAAFKNAIIAATTMITSQRSGKREPICRPDVAPQQTIRSEK
jgi:hypothetical protein